MFKDGVKGQWGWTLAKGLCLRKGQSGQIDIWTFSTEGVDLYPRDLEPDANQHCHALKYDLI